jgi:hypothetical protein
MSDPQDRELERLLSETDLSHRSRVRQTLRRDLLNQLENKSVESKRKFTLMTAFSVSVMALMVVIFGALVLGGGDGGIGGRGRETATPGPYNNVTGTASVGLPGDATPTAVPYTNLVTQEYGDYCFAYPEGFEKQDTSAMPMVTGPNLNPGVGGGAFGWVSVDTVEAQGRTARDAADEMLNAFQGLSVGESTVLLGGEEALVLDGMPGQDLTRMVFIVHNDKLLTLTFGPLGSDNAEANAQMQALFDMTTATWTWISSGVPCGVSLANDLPLLLTPTIVPDGIGPNGPVTATPIPFGPTLPPLSESDMENYTATIRLLTGLDEDVEIVFSGFSQSAYAPTYENTAHFLTVDASGVFDIDAATGNMVQFGFNVPIEEPGDLKSEDALLAQSCDYMRTYADGFNQYADDLRLEVLGKGAGTIAFRWELPMPYNWESTTANSTAMRPFAQLVLYEDGRLASYTNTLFYLLRDGLEYPEPEPGDNGCG